MSTGSGSNGPTRRELRSTIWKFTLDPWSGLVRMPQGAVLLHAHEQDNKVCVWAEVDPDAKIVHRSVMFVGTGHALPRETATYVGTVHITEVGVPLVLHIYDLGEKPE